MNRLTTKSNFLEATLVSFPIWIPFLYYFLLNEFPAYELLYLYFIFFVLGEFHFGATWVFLIDKSNRNFMREHFFYAYTVPILMIIFFVSTWFFISPFIAFFLSTLFNIFHVTRQSVGITKLYASDPITRKIPQIIVYVNSFMPLFYGFLKYINIDFINLHFVDLVFFVTLSILIISILASLFILSLNFKKYSNLCFSTITGSVLYAPFLLDISFIQAGAMGIGMHYIQYITLQMIIFFRKRKTISYEGIYDRVANNLIVISLFILFYILIMGMLLYFGRDHTASSDEFFASGLNFLYFIPFIMHNIHFYADMFIWKFSNPHIRKNIGSFLFG
tara:strand:- start:2612 stop:3610 length:999 start_codon:yes stop_codon:yes gene_type:complete